jgi:hypothetical protein
LINFVSPRDIGHGLDRTSPMLSDCAHGLFGSLMDDVIHSHQCTLTCELCGNSSTDSLACAGDKRHTPGQIKHVRVLSFEVP